MNLEDATVYFGDFVVKAEALAEHRHGCKTKGHEPTKVMPYKCRSCYEVVVPKEPNSPSRQYM